MNVECAYDLGFRSEPLITPQTKTTLIWKQVDFCCFLMNLVGTLSVTYTALGYSSHCMELHGKYWYFMEVDQGLLGLSTSQFFQTGWKWFNREAFRTFGMQP